LARSVASPLAAVFALGALLLLGFAATATAAPLPGGSLDPTTIPKYQQPLVIPPAMPMTGTVRPPRKHSTERKRSFDYYEIALKQFDQYILPTAWSQLWGVGPTTVWSYASMTDPRPAAEGGTLNYPAFTIEARVNRPLRVKWINDLVDENGDYLPPILPVDQTLHWANPPGGPGGTDTHGMDGTPYTGPVPSVVHVHGAHTTEDSDGYPEAWFLPAARNIPEGYATHGAYYEPFKQEFEDRWGQEWEPGSAVFQYPNDQRAATLWYHDHSLGMTRTNVYSGPAGFFLLRGGPETPWPALLPRPWPRRDDPAGKAYREIPIAIQDRSFNADGSLFYPDNRAFFEGLSIEQLQIPFMPGMTPKDEMSDVAPIWNPEFFGNTMVVNGKTWPYLDVEKARYRLRLLNGSQSRFLILKLDNGQPFWQIGSEGGFLPKPVQLTELLIAPAERADVIVDFTKVEAGTRITLLNVGPDEPFAGGIPDEDFDTADPGTTGQVMQFRVKPATRAETSLPAAMLPSYGFTPLGEATGTRSVSLNEEESRTVFVSEDADGNIVFDAAGSPFGPTAAKLGTYDPATGEATALNWMDPVTENPAVGATEIWELHNFTMDAHPIHIHLVQFQVVDRKVVDPMMSPHGDLGEGAVVAPETWESGYKDTVIAYPGEVTRIKARFDKAGLFVWHCHILEHEDNEMMRPYRVGPEPAPMP
jgi:FtsP/CotA-like multicopper oxidase with cupredoxin domain